jgi:uncharacterized OsmC-like protein
MGSISVRHELRDRFRVGIRSHELLVDQPAPTSGDDGPTPTELFVASLAACAAFYARRFLARRGLADGALTVRADFAMAADHSRVASIVLHVETPDGVPAELRGALERVVAACTVHESIRQAPAVSLEIATVDRSAQSEPVSATT